ncbi:MAG: c-type cytochrome [Proteobacteria bacterium]|nr:c-type cytochrome [Pseudomonadota bacterium]MBU1709793.1 c-type cytochrome [Pseudomonadota bacterium]
MKRITKLIIALFLVAFTASTVVAAQGNPKKGKFLYKKNCKTCHVKDGDGAELTPVSKTQNQWTRFFEKDKHKKNPESFNNLSEKDIRDIQQFLIDHAADSASPQLCG